MELVTRILAVAVLAQGIVAIPHERASVNTMDNVHRARRAPTSYFQQERNAVYNILFGRSPVYSKVMQERLPAYNKVMHERSPDHNKVTHERSPVHERQVTQYLDEEAASIISTLVTQYHQYLFGAGMNSTEFVALMDFLTGLQLEDPASIEPVMHDLLYSQFLRSVFLILEQHGLVKNAVRTLYRYTTFTFVQSRILIENIIEDYNNCEQDWCADGVPDQITSGLHLLYTCERIGLLSLDTDGTRTMNDIAGIGYSFWVPDFAEKMEENLNNLDNFHSATSDQEEEQHCTELTQAIRKMWNDLITDAEQWDPEASQIFRKIVFDWTGITMNSHQDIRNLICELLGRMRWSGFDGLYTTLLDSDILWSAIRQVYPLVIEQVNNADQILEDVLSQYIELDPDAPPNLSGQMTPFKLAKRLIDILRHDMGLLDLIENV